MQLGPLRSYHWIEFPWAALLNLQSGEMPTAYQAHSGCKSNHLVTVHFTTDYSRSDFGTIDGQFEQVSYIHADDAWRYKLPYNNAGDTSITLWFTYVGPKFSIHRPWFVLPLSMYCNTLCLHVGRTQVYCSIIMMYCSTVLRGNAEPNVLFAVPNPWCHQVGGVSGSYRNSHIGVT